MSYGSDFLYAHHNYIAQAEITNRELSPRLYGSYAPVWCMIEVQTDIRN